MSTNTLIANVNDQLSRLVCQLADLEETKNDLEKEEYEELKADTLAQLQDFEKSLENMKKGNLSLVGELQHAQLAIQAAIRSAFHTPEVMRMFAKKEPAQLRTHLENLKREEKLGKLTKDAYNIRAAEILTALKKLDEKLEPDEIAFLNTVKVSGLAQVAGDKEDGDVDNSTSTVLNTAVSQIKEARE
eukprot:c20729_g1_i2.p1 GENE.c20729_g1_i2~~c20729_g1_i2.p1  ORF type:complete len:188 (+),score=81.33 c20729_g1_i2:48-611(+)